MHWIRTWRGRSLKCRIHTESSCAKTWNSQGARNPRLKPPIHIGLIGLVNIPDFLSKDIASMLTGSSYGAAVTAFANARSAGMTAPDDDIGRRPLVPPPMLCRGSRFVS